MNKRRLCLLMFLVLLITGCSQPQNSLSEKASAEVAGGTTSMEEIGDPYASITDAPALEHYLSQIEFLETPAREYGESGSYISMDEDLVVRILYPVGEIESLNTALEEWSLETAAYYQQQSIGSSQSGEPAELTIDYDSYLIDDELVSVKLTGTYLSPGLAHPIDIIATFNANKLSGALLSLENILLPEGRDSLEQMVTEEAGIDAIDLDEHLLDLWTLTPEGLEITLERGDYLAMSEGTVTLLYPYDSLGSILSPEYLESKTSAETQQTSAEAGSGEAQQASTETALAETQQASTEADPAEAQQASTEADPAETQQTSKEADSEQETKPQTKQPDQLPNPVDGTKPMVALTFDDGPSAHTDRLLDIFSASGGKGTFFIVGNVIEGREATLQRMVSSGHEIGGHSWNHRQMTKLDPAELTNQIMNTRAKLYQVTGMDTTIIRPPYGSYNDQVKATAAELGVALINWSVDTLDWKHKDANKVYNSIMDQAKDGAIILCHDLHKSTVDAMERVIPDLIAQGYQLVTVSELFSHGGKEISPGQVYTKR